jgi:septum formation protein
MRGRSGVLHTGHCLVDASSGARAERVGSTLVRFGNPEAAELDAYISSGEPLRVAGAFTLDDKGGFFVDGIDGDPGTVLGLSLPLLRDMLAELSVPVTDLWS